MHHAFRVRAHTLEVEEKNLRLLSRQNLPHVFSVRGPAHHGEIGLIVELTGEDFTEERRLSSDDDRKLGSPGRASRSRMFLGSRCGCHIEIHSQYLYRVAYIRSNCFLWSYTTSVGRW